MTTCLTSIQYNAPWHQLEHVWVGRTYAPSFYETIKNTQVRDSLQTIAEETENDYQNLISTLVDLGVYVQRPEIDSNTTIMDFVDNTTGQINYNNSKSYTLIPRPPMQPRDCMLVVGNRMLATNFEHTWFKPLIDNLALTSWQKIYSTREFDAPLATVVGEHIIVDCRDHPWLESFFVETFPNKKIIPVDIGGHNDAVFCLLKPGVLVSTHHYSNYRDTLPGWSVKHIENQSWNAIPDWRKFKHSNKLKWWVPDQTHNQEFEIFVNTWIKHWVGHVAETVFDVNMLQINEHQVIVNNHNKEMFDFFRLQKIEPIVVPFRHRFFWDGGIHCVTNDIFRSGIAETYIKR